MPCLRLVFMASADFALPVLAALLDAGHEVVCVYSRPPRPAGRGHRERPSPVHSLAAEKAISVRTPKSLDGKDDQAAFAALAADAAVVVAYGLILPAAILAAPRLGCLNLHASLLPRWRGASPIQAAILHGDSETGVTIMQMDPGMDTGSIA
ncbi:MAG: methionyl-tRNA formyltransferase, partial [Rhodospirillales bacterium]